MTFALIPESEWGYTEPQFRKGHGVTACCAYCGVKLYSPQDSYENALWATMTHPVACRGKNE